MYRMASLRSILVESRITCHGSCMRKHASYCITQASQVTWLAVSIHINKWRDVKKCTFVWFVKLPSLFWIRGILRGIFELFVESTTLTPLRKASWEQTFFTQWNSQAEAKHRYGWVTLSLSIRSPSKMERWWKRPSLRQQTPCFRILKTNWKSYHHSKLFSYHKVQLHTALWSNGRGFDTAASDKRRRQRVFLTAMRRVCRHERYSPAMHFYSDDVYRYDWKRGAINITAHERTHAGRVHFSGIQKLYG